jgi:outer membrane protein assembly factor BamD
MDRADDARLRLVDLKQPIPRPTKAEVAQNKAEMASRHEEPMLTKVRHTFAKHPDVSGAPSKGEPSLVDTQPMSATDVVQAANRAAMGSGTSDSHSLAVETVGTGAPGENQAAPRSDAPAAADNNAAAVTAPPAAQPDPNELKNDANAVPDPNELKPNVSADSQAAAPPPQQVNEIQSGQTSSSSTAASSSSEDQQTASDSDISSSKPKKKKGLQKLNPF